MPYIGRESFPFGEIDPGLLASPSLDVYRGGCHTLENAIVSRTGSVRRRFGSKIIGQTYQNQPAALLEYRADAKEYILEIAASATAGSRFLRVWDVATRALIDFADGAEDYEPFGSSGDDGAVLHHFVEADLDDIQLIQGDRNRAYIIHPNRPPIFIERAMSDASTEDWKYGTVDNPARVIDYTVPIEVVYTSVAGNNGYLTSSLDLFRRDDEDGYFRIGGSASIDSGAAFVYSSWATVTKYVSPRRVDVTLVHAGNPGDDPLDWTGPYVPGSSFSSTISSSSSAGFDVRNFDNGGTPAISQSHIGVPFEFAGDLWLVTAIVDATEWTGVRLAGSGAVSGSQTTAFLGLAYNADTTDGGDRPWFRAYPIYASAVTGTVTLTSQQSLFGPEFLSRFLPVGHETTFDEFDGTAIGGTVQLAGGEVALTGSTGTASDFRYTGVVTKELGYLGPTIQFSLGWSQATGFPACGALHQRRLWLGGFNGNPRRLVASRVGDADDWEPQGEADAPMAIELSDPEAGRVTWMSSAEDLLVGTERGEFAVRGTPITPTSLGVDRQSAYGGSTAKSLVSGNDVLYVDISKRAIRATSFFDERQRYRSQDLTEHARHIFDGKAIAAMRSMTSPESLVLVRNATGELNALSLVRDSGVVGWSRWIQPSFPDVEGAATVDSYSSADTGGVALGFGSVQYAAQSFEGNGSFITGITVRVDKNGTPGGTITCAIYAHSGTFGTTSVPTGSALATATTSVSVASLSGSAEDISFTFNGTFKAEADTHYCWVLTGVTGGDITNHVVVLGDDDGGPATHEGNSSTSSNGSSWTEDADVDFDFTVTGQLSTTAVSTVGSIAVVRAYGSQQIDECWLVRRFNQDASVGTGTVTRTIEVLSDDYALDCQDTWGGAITTSGAASSGDFFGLLSNLSAVAVLADGVYLGEFATDADGDVSWGDVGLVSAPAVPIGGIGFDFLMVPTIPAIAIQGIGNTQGLRHQSLTALVYVVASRGLTVDDKLPEGMMAVPLNPPATAIEATTGWLGLYGIGEYGTQILVHFRQSAPYALEIGGINLALDYGSSGR